jgi:sulfoxide reductase heme-binding subunit YedZ
MNSILINKWTKAGVFLICLVPLGVLVWEALTGGLGSNPTQFLEHATGDWTLRFVAITLSITPLRRILRQPQLVRFRRMLGLFAFFYGCCHFSVYLTFDQTFDLHGIWADVMKRRYITVGFTAFVLMIPLALTSTNGWVRRLGAKRWQLLHRLVYVTAIAGVVHYYWLVKSDIHLPLIYGVIVALLLASRLFVSRTGRSEKTASLKLRSIMRQTGDTVTLRFHLPDRKPLRAKPGQFLTFDWVVDGKKLPRSYSISSSPLRTDYVEITVKQQGTVSSFLNRDAKEGLMVEAHGPFGRFYFDEGQDRDIVLFAGGSGITPIMSMLRYIEEVAANTEITLFYAVRSEHDVIFQEELANLQKRLPRFRSVIVASRPGPEWLGARGHVNRSLIEEHLGESRHRTFFLCGPAAFMASVKEILMSLSVPADKIRQESFTIGGPASTAPATSTCSVDFARSGGKYECSPTETLLTVAENHGIDIPYSCRVGQCGTCATLVLDGEVEMDVEDGLESALRDQGYRLLCVGRARGHVRLDA